MSTKTMRAGSVSLEMGKLKALTADLAKYKRHRIHVGVFSNHDARSGKGIGPSDPTLGNAEIGTIQEFGSIEKNIPERSFLRVPLMSYLPDAIRTLGPNSWRKLIIQDGLLKALKTLGGTAANTVENAFWTRGYGQWAANKKRTIQQKKSDSPLIDGGELAQSVTYRVVGP